MNALLDVILPVFAVIGFGYAAARWMGFSEAAVDGLMRFAQSFAIPCLLFKSIAHLDLRGGSVDLNRFWAFSKWFSASVTPPPLRASAG